MNDLEFSSLIMLYADFRLFISQHGVFLEAVLSFMSFRVGFCFIQTVYGAYLRRFLKTSSGHCIKMVSVFSLKPQLLCFVV